MESDALVQTYLRDHHAGSVGGTQAFERVAEGHGDAEVRERVGAIAADVREDQESLEKIMDALGVKPSSIKDAGTWLGERMARLKPNEHLAQRSPLSDVEELEALILGVHGKSQLWQALLQFDDERLDRVELQVLRRRADEQEAELQKLWLTQVPKLRQKG